MHSWFICQLTTINIEPRTIDAKLHKADAPPTMGQLPDVAIVLAEGDTLLPAGEVAILVLSTGDTVKAVEIEPDDGGEDVGMPLLLIAVTS